MDRIYRTLEAIRKLVDAQKSDEESEEELTGMMDTLNDADVD